MNSSSYISFSKKQLQDEKTAANNLAEQIGAVTRRKDGSILTSWHQVPGGWIEHHPKAIHNSKLDIATMLEIDYDSIPDKIAMEWVRALVTVRQLENKLNDYENDLQDAPFSDRALDGMEDIGLDELEI